jgi:D-alanine-D-alanine ligase
VRIAIVHNALCEASAPDEQDVIIQADAVCDALSRCGHVFERLACDLNLARSRDRIQVLRPDLVFNLVESLDGTGRLIHLFPCVLDAMGQRYTGAGAEALMLTSNKLLAKQMLHDAGLPTPPWVARGCPGAPVQRNGPALPAQRWIIKSVWEHASIGLDEAAIVDEMPLAVLDALIQARAPHLGGACFAEAFIKGREFNLSILDGPEGPVVLPPAEIIFEGFDPDEPWIVDYRAKWDAQSYAFHHTPRTFAFGPRDHRLLDRLCELGRACWLRFGLRGYARVDFRVDTSGNPWILEINANPCLSPDAGFAAAVQQAGMTYWHAVEQIVSSGASMRLPGQTG